MNHGLNQRDLWPISMLILLLMIYVKQLHNVCVNVLKCFFLIFTVESRHA